jgi:hypothetical protein
MKPRAAMEQRGFANLWLAETEDKQAFSEALDDARNANEFGQSVDGHTAEELADAKTYLSADGLSGVAIEPDGNITSVFRHPASPQRGAVKDLLITAIANGATKHGIAMLPMASMTCHKNMRSLVLSRLRGFGSIRSMPRGLELLAPWDDPTSCSGNTTGTVRRQLWRRPGPIRITPKTKFRRCRSLQAKMPTENAWGYRDSLIGKIWSLTRGYRRARGEAPLIFSMVDSIGKELSPETAAFFSNSHMREGGQYEKNTKGPLMRMYRSFRIRLYRD